MIAPSAREIRQSLVKWLGKDRVVWRDGWDTRGRPWEHGLRGVVEHHLAGVGDGAVDWLSGESMGYQYPACNACIRRDGTVHVFSVLSANHSGTGGPWPRAGVPANVGSYYLWGTEFESWGRVPDFTKPMWDAQARLDCALREVAGKDAFPSFRRLINHKDWTDGGPGLGMVSWLPTRGRKNDTLYGYQEFRRNARERWSKGPM